jgi:error-prone DNA polymerase
MSDLQYTELKAYSYYSFLRGASSSPDLIAEAIRLGLNGLAITDMGGVYGLPRAYHTIKEMLREKDLSPETRKALLDFQLICGCEILFKNEAHASVVLIAPTRAAYGAMCRLLTRSHATEAKGTGSLLREEFFSLLASTPHAEELILFPQWEEEWLQERGSDCDWLKKWDFFGASEKTAISQNLAQTKSMIKNPVYLPLARHADGLDEERTQFAREFAAKLGREIVAHQGVLVHHASQQIVQDTLTAIREGQPLCELGRKLTRNAERRLKSPAEMQKLFSDLPEAIALTQTIRSQCVFSLGELRYQYPTEWIPQTHTAQSYLEELCAEGIKKRYPHGASEKVIAQLKHELDLISQLNFADYFLTVYDIVREARELKILCQGRGSAANSVVCYAIGITAIDPISMNLLFERFISVERGEPPDIDVDFEHDRREEIIQYIYKKYGRDRAAMVSAVVTYRDRSALREVAKAFSVPVGTLSAREVQRKFFAPAEEKKLDIGERKGDANRSSTPKPILQNIHRQEKDPEDFISEVRRQKILEVTEAIQGFPRHLSIHSGGFTLSHEPIDTLVPIEPATMEGRTIIQWDKFDLDILGLLKIDVLSLGMLSAIRRNLDLVGLDLYGIPPDCPGTYAMICRADTIGVFQIESRAQMSMLPRLRPRNFYDLVVEIALVRPGPIVGKMVHPYLKNRANPAAIVLPHPALAPILEKTYGVPIFQEQVMKMAVQLGGFSPGESDRLRRAIGAWRSQGSIDEMGTRLMQGLIDNKIPREYAQQIFDQIQGFAEYGFPESHAASFALLTYVSCYLKHHYPAEFLCALLNSQPMGFYSPHSLIDDAKRHGVKVLPVSVNHSHWDCTIENPNTVRMGFQYVQKLAKPEAEKISSLRGERRFSSFQDFVLRSHFESKNLRALAMAGAFECVGLNARDALFEVLAVQVGLFQTQSSIGDHGDVGDGGGLDSNRLYNDDLDSNGNNHGVASAQGSLFPTVMLAPMSTEEKVVQDYATNGFSARGHPMEFLRKKLRSLPSPQKNRGRHAAEMNSQAVKQLENGVWVTVPGLSVVLQRPPTAKGTAFATLEDEFGVLDLIFHKKFFDQYRDTIREESFFWIRGVLQRDREAAQLIVKGIEPIFTEYVVPIAPGDHQSLVPAYSRINSKT